MRGLVVVLLGAFFVTACGQKHGGGGDKKFLLPWPDANGEYRLQEVTIETLASPDELRGEAAEVYSRASFSESGFDGALARPHVTKAGDVYIPLDSESSTAISIYAQFDRLFKFEKEIGSLAQVNWPRRVGIETALRGSAIFKHNNAHYFTKLDIIGVVPFVQDDRVPVAMNHGILAHEHFHAHFQNQVMNAVNLPKQETITSAIEDIFNPFAVVAKVRQKLNPSPTRDLNDVVLRAWNEGLADLFASLYLRQPDFFTPSLPSEAEGRNLDAQARRFHGNLGPSVGMRRLSDGEIAHYAYGQGTNLARLMYGVANTGNESPKVFLARVLQRLPAIAKMAASQLDARVMDFEDVVPVILQGFEVNSAICDDLRRAMINKATMKRSFPKCGF